jgi:hypothetical protein
MLEGRELLTMTAPVTFESIAGIPGANGYFRSPVTLTFTPFEAGYTTNQLTTYYRVNNGPLIQGNSVTLTRDGFYNVAYVSADSAGHFGAASDQFIAIDRTPPTVTEFVNPSTLWPPNHKLVPVVVAGHVADNFSGVNRFVTYQVFDSEGQDQPAGFAPVDANGNYSFVVYLDASRLGQDKNGRVYSIDVAAFDRAGNASMTLAWVIVPHDQGNGGGNDNSQGNENGNGHG